ncbi:hypothetical protein Tco_1401435 [Tanacetum coccineum]
MKSKDNDKGSRLKITQHEGTSLQQDKDQDSITQRQSNLHKSKETRFKDLASGEILPTLAGRELGVSSLEILVDFNPIPIADLCTKSRANPFVK